MSDAISRSFPRNRSRSVFVFVSLVRSFLPSCSLVGPPAFLRGREREMLGELLYEIGVEVPASQAWDLFCSLRIVELLLNLKHLIHSIELVHGDGGVGTILKLTFQDARVPAGSKSMSYSLEKITKLDHDNRVKELDVVEGGLLDMGFTLYRYRIQVFEKGAAACTIKFTIEYELPDELAATNASLVSNEILVALSDLVKDHLLSLHAGGATIN